jgi:hypothetical protein
MGELRVDPLLTGFEDPDAVIAGSHCCHSFGQPPPGGLTGIKAVIADPRSTLQECLKAISIVELADNDCWANLVQLARGPDCPTRMRSSAR